MERFPATDAVGVPPAILRTANFAELVDVPPMRRSRVLLFGLKTPLDVSSVQLDPPVPAPGHVPHVGAFVPDIKQRPDELVDAPFNCPVDTVAYITLLFALNPEKVIVPEEVNPVNPVNVPCPIKLAALAVKASVPPGAICTSPVADCPKQGFVYW